MRLSRTARLAALGFALTALAPAAHAQQVNPLPRFGVAFNGLVSTLDGIGIGVRGRATAPVNADLSIGLDLGATGFVLGGRNDASYVIEPQLSVVINLPGQDFGRVQNSRSSYLLAGVGAYLPTGQEDGSKGGPTVHVGLGWVQTLTETQIFYEINPALVVARNNVGVAIPVRLGLIF